MGMYDTVDRMGYKWQTKDLGCQGGEYRVSKDGDFERLVYGTDPATETPMSILWMKDIRTQRINLLFRHFSGTTVETHVYIKNGKVGEDPTLTVTASPTTQVVESTVAALGEAANTKAPLGNDAQTCVGFFRPYDSEEEEAYRLTPLGRAVLAVSEHHKALREKLVVSLVAGLANKDFLLANTNLWKLADHIIAQREGNE